MMMFRAYLLGRGEIQLFRPREDPCWGRGNGPDIRARLEPFLVSYRMHNESIVLTPYYHGRVLNDLDVMRIAGKFAVISGSLVDLRKENVLHFFQQGLFHVVELTFAHNRAARPVWVVAGHHVDTVYTCCSQRMQYGFKRHVDRPEIEAPARRPSPQHTLLESPQTPPTPRSTPSNDRRVVICIGEGGTFSLLREKIRGLRGLTMHNRWTGGRLMTTLRPPHPRS